MEWCPSPVHVRPPWLEADSLQTVLFSFGQGLALFVILVITYIIHRDLPANGIKVACGLLMSMTHIFVSHNVRDS